MGPPPELDGSLLLPSGLIKLLPARGLTIGRERENDISLDQPSVSRHHARVGYVDGQAFVEDLRSFNGTYVNGQRINGSCGLRDGDRIGIEGSTFVFQRLPKAAEAPAPAVSAVSGSPAAEPSSVALEETAEVAEEPRVLAEHSEPASPGVATNSASSRAPPAASSAAAPERPAVSPDESSAPAVEANPLESSPVHGVPFPETGASEGAWRGTGITRHTIVGLPDGRRATELGPIGSLTIETAEVFRGFIAETLDTDTRYIFLDLSQLEYVDSTGLGALIHLRREATAAGGELWLYHVTPEVRRIFELTNLHKVLNIGDTRAAAFTAALAK